MSSDEFPQTFQTSVNQSKDAGELNQSINHVPRPSVDVHVDYFFYVTDLDAVRQSWTDDRAFYPSTVTYGLTFALGLIGNSLVLVALLGDRKSARNVTTILMVSLAIADLLFLLICVPYEMANKFISYWAAGVTLCKLAGFVEMLSALASVLNLTAVSVERYHLCLDCRLFYKYLTV